MSDRNGRDPLSACADLDALLASVRGDDEVVRELVAMFHEDTPGQLAEIRQAAACRDGVRLAAVAHTLKGTAGVFHAAAAREAAFRLERIGLDPAWDGAPAAVAALEAEIGRLAEALQGLADRGGKAPTPDLLGFSPPVVERRG